MSPRDARFSPTCPCLHGRWSPFARRSDPAWLGARFFVAKCDHCGHELVEVWAGVTSVPLNVAIIVPPEDGWDQEAVRTWFHDIVDPLWRAWSKGRAEARGGAQQAAMAHCNLTLGLPPYATREMAEDTLRSGAWDQIAQSEEAFRQTEAFLWPRGYERMVVPPPPPPAVLAAYVWQREGWVPFGPRWHTHVENPDGDVRVDFVLLKSGVRAICPTHGLDVRAANRVEAVRAVREALDTRRTSEQHMEGSRA